jgi:hypothetical protein
MYIETVTKIELTEYEKEILRKSSDILEAMYEDFTTMNINENGFNADFFETLFSGIDYILDNIEDTYKR